MQFTMSDIPPQSLNASATSLEYTQAQVKRTVRDVFNVGSEIDDRLLLDAYAQAVGADVAASDRFNLGTFMSEEQVQREGDLMADHSLAWGVCTTDDREAFRRRYAANFFTGYFQYVGLARAYDGVTF